MDLRFCYENILGHLALHCKQTLKCLKLLFEMEELIFSSLLFNYVSCLCHNVICIQCMSGRGWLKHTNISQRKSFCFSVFFSECKALCECVYVWITIKISSLLIQTPETMDFGRAAFFRHFKVSLRLGDFKDVVWISSQDGICNGISFTVGCLQMTKSVFG